MRWIHIIDTSVMVNLLNVPHMNADRAQVWAELETLVQEPAANTLVLPITTIIETGNHIAHVTDGNLRRTLAQTFSQYLLDTAEGRAPWTFGAPPFDETLLRSIAAAFPDAASRSIGIGDVTIVSSFHYYVDTVPVSVRIWSLDRHLQGYVYQVPEIGR